MTTTPKTTARAALSTIAALVIVAAAALVWHNLPTPTDLYGPFEVRGTLDEPVEGRAITATVTSVRIAPQVNSVPAAGIWVVIDATIEAPRSTELPKADLIVGPNTYAASDRFFLDTLRAEISPGIPARGSWVFDVAPSLVEAGASDPLLLRVWAGSDILDSRLVIDIPADDPGITRSDEVKLTRPEVSAK
ncbi:hypothetical protein [Mycobacterium sp. 236(2023)]|uniref:hypothetical protein n=1 Tax=Mycobacterium sp. 236(2023) TaxID=3038163 RepID=UPI002414DFD9|nr:hypothetical protein [Mycobacterium sp. 236(2023)]MDG4668713.1 hypothetical protein [Mycobacterium sp. 236(2023)]